MSAQRIRHRVGLFLLASFLGSFAFWFVSLFVHATGGDGRGVVVLSLLFSPVLVGITCYNLTHLWKRWLNPYVTTLAVTLGIWYLGMPWISLSQAFAGNPKALASLWENLPAYLMLGPLATYMASAYDGSLGGFLIVSLALMGVLIVGLFRGIAARCHSKRAREAATSPTP